MTARRSLIDAAAFAAMALAALAAPSALAQNADWVNPDTGSVFGAPRAERSASASTDAASKPWRNPDADPNAAAATSSATISADDALIVHEFFADREFETDPTWRPWLGAWVLDPQYGLRPVLETNLSALVALGELPPQRAVEAAFGDSDDAPQGAALIGFEIEAPNSARIDAEIVDHAGFGAATLLLHQGAPAMAGYRVEIAGGEWPKVFLKRYGKAGVVTLGAAAAPEFKRRGRLVSVTLRRTGGDRLVVRIDGRDAIAARDDGFKKGWRGVAFLTSRGDYSLREVSVSAAE